MQLTEERAIFLDVLRHSLWSEGVYYNARLASQSGAEVLGKVIKIASDQTLLGIVGNTLLNNSEGIEIEKKKAIKLGYKILKIQTRHSILSTVIESLSKTFSDKGIDLVLLKGEGVGTLYPDPSLRQSGDIDLYVGKTNYEKGKVILNSIRDDDKPFSESRKHFECHYKSISIELHIFADKLKFRPIQNKYFQQLTLEGTRRSDRSLCCGSSRIKLPTVQFDALFSLEHLWHHMLTGGVGLRQVCDLSMILHSFHDEIDKEKLEIDLKNCHLYKAWQYICYIAVNYIGLPENECPLYTNSESVSEIADELLQIIFEDGNFGKKNNKANEEGRPDNFVGSKFHSLKNNFRRLNMTMKYVQFTDRLSYYLSYILESIDRLRN